jgi:hypothetical protein
MNVLIPKQLLVSFRWKTICASNQVGWPFSRLGQPNRAAFRALRKIMKGARVYRFCFSDPGGNPQCYVGESENSERRLSQYMRALARLRCGARTGDLTLADMERAWRELQTGAEVRVAAAIQNAELDGTLVELQLIDFDGFGFNRIFISPEGLSSPFQRRAVENLAILDSEASGFRMMNNGMDLNAKWLIKKLKENAERWDAMQTRNSESSRDQLSAG